MCSRPLESGIGVPNNGCKNGHFSSGYGYQIGHPKTDTFSDTARIMSTPKTDTDTDTASVMATPKTDTDTDTLADTFVADTDTDTGYGYRKQNGYGYGYGYR